MFVCFYIFFMISYIKQAFPNPKFSYFYVLNAITCYIFDHNQFYVVKNTIPSPKNTANIAKLLLSTYM